LTGAAFIALCVLGMSAVFFPSRCSKNLSVKHAGSVLSESDDEGVRGSYPQKASRILGLRLTHGHHPLCEGFVHHEFQIGSKTFCVACMGLFSGALVTIPATVAYFFFEHSIKNAVFPFLFLGVCGVASILVQYLFFEPRNRVSRFLLNAFFVLASFLLLVAVDMAAESFSLNLFVLGCIIFWLYTRIVCSRLRHGKICESCGLNCAVFGCNMESSR